jgi:hypothetical protein
MFFRLKSQDNNTTAAISSGEKRPFMDGVEKHFLSKQLGENGMPEFTNEGIGSDLLALNQLVRGGDSAALARKILETGSPVDVAYLIVMIFSTRNARGGKGEKKLAYEIYLEVLKTMPVTGLSVLQLFPHYGYWKDLFLLMELVKKDSSLSADTKSKFNMTCNDLLATQLTTDVKVVQAHEEDKKPDQSNSTPPKISLLAKWLPRDQFRQVLLQGRHHRERNFLGIVLQGEISFHCRQVDKSLTTPGSFVECSLRRRDQLWIGRLESDVPPPHGFHESRQAWWRSLRRPQARSNGAKLHRANH